MCILSMGMTASRDFYLVRLDKSNGAEGYKATAHRQTQDMQDDRGT